MTMPTGTVRRAGIVRLAALLVALAAPNAAAAPADGLPPSFDRQLLDLAPAREGAAACFVRHYDARHLKAHPQQKVKALALLVRVVRDDEAKAKLRYDFQLGADVVGRGIGRTAGECGWAHAPERLDRSGGRRSIGCSVECDGGGVSVERRDADTLIARLKRIYLSGDCGGDDAGEPYELLGEPDDREFLLKRAALAACRPLAAR